MKTLESKEKIVIDMEVRFGELWDGDGEGKELLESGSVSPDNESIVGFVVIEENDSILNTVVRITDIY